MSNKQNTLSTTTPWDMVAEGYSEVTMKLFQGYTDKALELAQLNESSQIVDIACGPGTLSLTAAKKGCSVQALDFSQNMISLLKQTISSQNIDNITPHCGDGQALPYADESFDAAFSMFGLMFFPDRNKGYTEIFRTLKPGGRTVISSWSPVAESPAMMAMFGALQAINPELSDPQADLESLENPEIFQSELLSAGFREVEIHPVTETFPFKSVEQFWQDMVKGSAPIVMMKNSLPDDVWQAKSEIALNYLDKTLGSDTHTLSANAFLGYGIK